MTLTPHGQRSLLRRFGLLLVFLLTACGGGGDPAAPQRVVYASAVLVHPSDRIITDEPGFNTHLQLIAETDPVKSVAAQSGLPGQIILAVGDTRNVGFHDLEVYLLEAIKHPRIGMVYLYDELFWNGQRIEIGRDEAALNAAARQVHAAGLRTVVSMLPDVILAPNFAMTDINALDVIAIDVYPAGRSNYAYGVCAYNANRLTTLLFCSMQKLKAMGYRGEVWYVSEGFGVTSEPFDALREKLVRQRETMRDAKNFGVSGIVPFGLYLGAGELQREPHLYQGQGSALQDIVRP